MRELSRYFFLAGAVPFLVLGTIHALVTPTSIVDEKGLSPSDPAVRDAMTRATLLLTRRLSLWQAWVGFNLSHSLGAVLFGAVVALIGRSPASFQSQAHVFLPLAVAVSACYLVIGLRYWFRKPITGIGISAGCFVVAWLLHLFGRSSP
jgi:hypothetical protein